MLCLIARLPRGLYHHQEPPHADSPSPAGPPVEQVPGEQASSCGSWPHGLQAPFDPRSTPASKLGASGVDSVLLPGNELRFALHLLRPAVTLQRAWPACK